MINMRPAQEIDARQLYDLARMFNESSHPDNWEDVADYLRNTADIICVAEDAGTPVGYCCGRYSLHLGFRQPIADVTELFVKESHRKKGLANSFWPIWR